MDDKNLSATTGTGPRSSGEIDGRLHQIGSFNVLSFAALRQTLEHLQVLGPFEKTLKVQENIKEFETHEAKYKESTKTQAPSLVSDCDMHLHLSRLIMDMAEGVKEHLNYLFS